MWIAGSRTLLEAPHAPPSSLTGDELWAVPLPVRGFVPPLGPGVVFEGEAVLVGDGAVGAPIRGFSPWSGAVWPWSLLRSGHGGDSPISQADSCGRSTMFAVWVEQPPPLAGSGVRSYTATCPSRPSWASRGTMPLAE